MSKDAHLSEEYTCAGYRKYSNTSFFMEHNFSEIEEISLLEEQLCEKLLSIANFRQPLNEQRKLRNVNSSGKTLTIHSTHRKLHNNHFHYGVDEMAHLLTTGLIETQPLIQSGIRHLILLPEMVKTDSYLLTHLYLSHEAILARYAYPRRFDSTIRLPLTDRFENQVLLGCGLMGNVARSVTPVEDKHSRRLHKFVTPLKQLHSSEFMELEELYSLSC